jgi:cytochrome P450
MLLTDDEVRALAQSDLDALPRIVEETIRFHPPVLLDQRQARRKTTFAGAEIAEGQILHACIGAANRDPAHFREPDRFEPFRSETDHVSFGHGAHYCIGAGLSRELLPTLVTTLFERFPSVRLAPGVSSRWRPDAFRHRLTSLDVVLV